MEPRFKFSLGYFLMLFTLMLFLDSVFFSGPAVHEISYSHFRELLRQGKVQSVILEQDRIYGLEKPFPKADTATPQNAPSKGDAGFTPHQKHAPWYLDFGPLSREREQEVQRQFVVIPLQDPQLLPDLQAHGVDYRGKIESHWFSNFLSNWIIPLGLFFLVWSLILRRMGKGANFLNLGKNKAKIYEADSTQKVTFEDVAGVDEAVEEVKEVVSFLKEPDRFTRLGAKLPRAYFWWGPQEQARPF